jgi:hypothetical protein
MAAQKHIHKYRRVKLGRDKTYTVYACAFPDCTHYMPTDRIVGRRTICWVCDKPTIIWKDRNGVLAKPHCKDCTRRKEDSFDLPPLQIPDILP